MNLVRLFQTKVVLCEFPDGDVRPIALTDICRTDGLGGNDDRYLQSLADDGLVYQADRNADGTVTLDAVAGRAARENEASAKVLTERAFIRSEEIRLDVEGNIARVGSAIIAARNKGEIDPTYAAEELRDVKRR